MSPLSSVQLEERPVLLFEAAEGVGDKDKDLTEFCADFSNGGLRGVRHGDR